MTKLKHARGLRRRSPRKRPSRKMKIKELEGGHKQWELKAGFSGDGTMITLRDLVSSKTPLPIESLTEPQLRELTLERLRSFPKYSLRVLGRRRPVSQRTAISEVKHGTPLGRFLVETEQNIIRLLLERIGLGGVSRRKRKS